MMNLFAGIGGLLWALAACGFVWFLHRIAKSLSVALEASARRDGGKALAIMLKKLIERD